MTLWSVIVSCCVCYVSNIVEWLDIGFLLSTFPQLPYNFSEFPSFAFCCRDMCVCFPLSSPPPPFVIYDSWEFASVLELLYLCLFLCNISPHVLRELSRKTFSFLSPFDWYIFSLFLIAFIRMVTISHHLVIFLLPSNESCVMTSSTNSKSHVIILILLHPSIRRESGTWFWVSSNIDVPVFFRFLFISFFLCHIYWIFLALC